MARTSSMAKYRKDPKFKVRRSNRCRICGRSKGYYRRFDMCRLCLRELALKGEVPGVVKSSW
jgi:small subunit ribosomal protein S14